MAILVNRAASGLVVGVFLLAAAIDGGLPPCSRLGFILPPPLVCIWFPDEMGSVAYAHGLPLNESPGCLVMAGGWLLLLLPIILVLVGYLRGG